MIGIRPLASMVAVAVGLAVALGAGSPRPEVEIGARRAVIERVERADQALSRLEREVAPALDAARAGAARVVAGDEPPAPMLERSAELLVRAQEAAADARRAVTELERARRARRPDASPLPVAPAPGELESIASQLRSSADAANRFAAMRARAAGVAGTLRAAIAALDAGDVDAAASLAREARTAHDAVAAWEVELVTLPVWLETTDAMIGAVERIVAATEGGDEAAAAAAAADFAAIADDGATADRALRIAMSEGGNAVTAAPLGRLASVLAAIGDLRASLRSASEGAKG